MSSSPSPFRPAATAPGPLTPSDDIDRLLNQSLGDDADMPGSGGHSPFLSFDAWGGAAVAGHSPASGPVRSNELAFVRSLCNKHSFTPYQREELEGLAANTDSPLLRDIRIYAKQCVIEKRLEEIISSAASYVVSPALMQNIRSIAVAVLLSPKLLAYKGEVPKESVLKVLLSRDRLHIPNTYEHDANVSNTINSAIAGDLVQVRSNFKKLIGASVKKRTSIFDLAKLLVDGSRCVVTVPLCSKIAVMRKVYVEDSGFKYWDQVDARLELIREKVKKDDEKINRILLAILFDDKALYGYKASDRMAMSAGSWQQEVDDTIAQTESDGEAGAESSSSAGSPAAP